MNRRYFLTTALAIPTVPVAVLRAAGDKKTADVPESQDALLKAIYEALEALENLPVRPAVDLPMTKAAIEADLPGAWRNGGDLDLIDQERKVLWACFGYRGKVTRESDGSITLKGKTKIGTDLDEPLGLLRNGRIVGEQYGEPFKFVPMVGETEPGKSVFDVLSPTGVSDLQTILRQLHFGRPRDDSRVNDLTGIWRDVGKDNVLLILRDGRAMQLILVDRGQISADDGGRIRMSDDDPHVGSGSTFYHEGMVINNQGDYSSYMQKCEDAKNPTKPRPPKGSETELFPPFLPGAR